MTGRDAAQYLNGLTAAWAGHGRAPPGCDANAGLANKLDHSGEAVALQAHGLQPLESAGPEPSLDLRQ